jgi:hypothetical protein
MGKNPIENRKHNFQGKYCKFILGMKKNIAGLGLCHFQQYFSYIVVVRFIDGGNRSTRRKSPSCRKSHTNLSYNVVSSTCLSGFKLTTLEELGTDCIGSYKSNYHTIKTLTAPERIL